MTESAELPSDGILLALVKHSYIYFIISDSNRSTTATNTMMVQEKDLAPRGWTCDCASKNGVYTTCDTVRNPEQTGEVRRMSGAGQTSQDNAWIIIYLCISFDLKFYNNYRIFGKSGRAWREQFKIPENSRKSENINSRILSYIQLVPTPYSHLLY